MIYGYDDELKTLYYCDHDADGTYRTDMACPYSEFIEAYERFDKSLDWPDYEFNNNLCIIKPLPTKEYGLDIESIRTAIILYIDPPRLSHLDCVKKDISRVRDRQVYDNFKEYYGEIIKGNLPFNNRLQEMHLLYDHKKVMRYRIKYFTQNNLVQQDPIFEEYCNVENILLQIRNLLIKFMVTQDYKCLLKCIDRLKEAEELEIPILERFVHSFL